MREEGRSTWGRRPRLPGVGLASSGDTHLGINGTPGQSPARLRASTSNRSGVSTSGRTASPSHFDCIHVEERLAAQWRELVPSTGNSRCFEHSPSCFLGYLRGREGTDGVFHATRGVFERTDALRREPTLFRTQLMVSKTKLTPSKQSEFHFYEASFVWNAVSCVSAA